MKLSIALYIAATTASSVSAFTPSITRFNTAPRSTSLLRVSNTPKKTTTTGADLAADFEEVGPEDVLAGDSTSGAKEGQAEVVLVGCGAPNRGMGWYHAIQMLEGR